MIEFNFSDGLFEQIDVFDEQIIAPPFQQIDGEKISSSRGKCTAVIGHGFLSSDDKSIKFIDHPVGDHECFCESSRMGTWHIETAIRRDSQKPLMAPYGCALQVTGYTFKKAFENRFRFQ